MEHTDLGSWKRNVQLATSLELARLVAPRNDCHVAGGFGTREWKSIGHTRADASSIRRYDYKNHHESEASYLHGTERFQGEGPQGLGTRDISALRQDITCLQRLELDLFIESEGSDDIRMDADRAEATDPCSNARSLVFVKR